MLVVRLPKSKPLSRHRSGAPRRVAGRALKVVTAVSAALMPALANSAEPWQLDNMISLPDGGRTSQKVELVDFNADGWVDIVFANSKGEGVTGGPPNRELNQLLKNDGGTGFTEVATAFEDTDNAWVIKAGDVDNDGDADLVVGDNFTGSMSYVLINDGNGMFMREDIPFSANQSIGELELGDIDGDGNLDVLAADWGNLPHGQIDDPGETLRLWLGNGDGTFTNGGANLMMGSSVPTAWSFDLELIDFNGDYWLDAIVSTRGDADTARVLINDGQGNLANHPVPSLQPMNTKNINTAFTPMDFNGDGWIDFLTLQDGGVSQCQGDPPVCARRNSVQINDTKGQFVNNPMDYWAPANNPGKNDFDATTLDFNNDGKADFVVLGTNINGTARILLNDGTKFTPSMPLLAFPVVPELNDTVSLLFADFNHDRREDAAVAQRDGALTNHVLLGSTDPTDGVDEDNTPPRIYDDNFAMKLPNLLFFGKDAGFMARVNDYKTPTHWHDYLFDDQLASLNLTGIGADKIAHNRRLPYMEFALSLANPDDIKTMPDTDPNKFIAPSIWFGEALWEVGFTVPYNGKPVDTLTWQYCAIDAQNNKTCLGPFSVNLEIDPNDCGDGVKEEWEECDDPNDPLCVACANTCGDGVCENPPENFGNCPEDCRDNPCDHDGICEPPEDEMNCPDDCDYGGYCGDMICQDPPENEDNCPTDCPGPCDHDGVCEPPENETNCPDDCDYGGFCGDDICQNPPETPENCPQDCSPEPTEGGFCGDNVCDPSETIATCPEDCGPVCGDGMCTDPETEQTCPEDCGGATMSEGECEDPAGSGQCELDDDGCGCVAEPDSGRGLWASLLLFGVFGVRRFRRRA